MYPELDRALRFIFNVTDSYSSVFLAVDRGKLRIISYHSLGDKIAYRKVVPIAGSGIYSVALKNQRPIVINNYDRDPSEFFFYKDEEGIKSVAIIPVKKRGVLHVDSKRSYLFTDKVLKILQEFVDILEDIMENILLKMEKKGLATELLLIERGIPLAIKGDIEGILKIFMEASKADVAFLASKSEGIVDVDLFIPDELKEARPLPKESILYRIIDARKPFYTDKLEGVDSPVFWKMSPLNNEIKSLLCIPTLHGIIGFCSLKGGRGANLKILMKPLSIILPLIEMDKGSAVTDPVTGFLMGDAFRRSSEGYNHYLEVKLSNIVNIYEELGPERGDSFVKEFSEVLKKVISSRITFKIIFGRVGPHHFRVALPEEFRDARELMRLLKLAFENLSICVGSKNIKPRIEMRFV